MRSKIERSHKLTHFTRCLTHVPVGIFQKFSILKIYSDFKRKSISAGNEAWDNY